jgi:hypothetical protein
MIGNSHGTIRFCNIKNNRYLSFCWAAVLSPVRHPYEKSLREGYVLEKALLKPLND